VVPEANGAAGVPNVSSVRNDLTHYVYVTVADVQFDGIGAIGCIWTHRSYR
jgi:hypothetical protein